METVKFLKPHTHEGVDLEPGATLEVEKDRADWLISLGVAQPSGEATRKPKKEA